MRLSELLKKRVVTLAECRQCTATEAEVLREADKRGFPRAWFAGGTLFHKLTTLLAEANITIIEGKNHGNHNR